MLKSAVFILLASALSAAPAQASSAMEKYFRDCDISQSQMIVNALAGKEGKYKGARARVDAAWVAAKSTATSERGKRARAAHKAIFKEELSETSAQFLKKIYTTMGKLPIKVCTKPDNPLFRHCKNLDAFVAPLPDGKNEVHFCPKYFDKPNDKNPDEQRVRRLVHESAHLAGLPPVENEGYGHEFLCGSGGVAVPDGVNANLKDIADNWSLFVHCAAGEKDDEPSDVISPGKY